MAFLVGQKDLGLVPFPAAQQPHVSSLNKRQETSSRWKIPYRRDSLFMHAINHDADFFVPASDDCKHWLALFAKIPIFELIIIHDILAAAVIFIWSLTLMDTSSSSSETNVIQRWNSSWLFHADNSSGSHDSVDFSPALRQGQICEY